MFKITNYSVINNSGELYYSTDITHDDMLSFTSLPFTDLSIDWRREEASTMSFKSPIKLENGDRIRYADSDRDFGGQVYKINKSYNNLYNYDCISYKRLYDTKIIASYSNKTSNYILKDLLKKNPNNFRYDGLKSKSSVRHVSLSWNNKSLWEVIGNLAWLEYKAGNYINYYIDSVGRLVWEDIPTDKNILSVSDVLDYNMKNDSADFITNAIIINQLNNSTLADVKANNDILLRWGIIQEFGDCDVQNSSSTSSSNGGFKTNYVNIKINKYTNKVPNKALSIVKQICNSKSKDKDNLKKIYNWVQKHIKYTFYYNTHKSVSKVISTGKGNCCEQAALCVALARGAGIKSQFVHGHNHVWSRHYINGGWFAIDCTTSNGWGRHLHTSTYGGPPYTYHNTLSF